MTRPSRGGDTDLAEGVEDQLRPRQPERAQPLPWDRTPNGGGGARRLGIEHAGRAPVGPGERSLALHPRLDLPAAEGAAARQQQRPGRAGCRRLDRASGGDDEVAAGPAHSRSAGEVDRSPFPPRDCQHRVDRVDPLRRTSQPATDRAAGEGDRQRWSVGSELSVPVLANLTVNVAGRYDHYDSGSTSFGGDFTPSANVEYRPISSLLLRAGYTSSFDAPDLAQVFVETGFFTGGTDYINCQEIYQFANGTLDGFDPNDCEATTLFAQRVGAQTFGGEPLDAETGNSYWLGFAWDILDDLSLTVDYTNMTLDQRVIQQSVQGLLNDDYACFIGDEPTNTACDDVDLQIIRVESPETGVSFIQDFFVTSVNQYEEKGQFIDVGLTYNLSTEKGLFQFQADYNNVISHSLKLTPDSEKQNLKSDPIVGGWDFRASFVGAVTWTYEDFGTTFTGIYRGKTTVFNCTSGTNGCVGNVTGENYYETENWWVDSYLTFNWTASYNWTDQWMSRVRVVNVFDEKPPKDDTMDFFDQPWYNIYVYPGAGIGRYAALELEYTF